MSLIRCINCDKIFFKSLFDQWPEYEVASEVSREPLRIVEKDDFQDFLRNHTGHRMEGLTILEDSYVSEKPYAEPMKASYFKATNGKETFVIKKFREKISDPVSYELICGDYSLKCVALEVQSKEIEKQLEAEFAETPFTKAESDAFLHLYRRVAANTDVGNLERVPEDSSHPLQIFYRMDDTSLFYLLRNCRRIFRDDQYRRIAEFIHRHKENGVLLLKATFAFRITEKPKIRKEIEAPVILPEARRIGKKR
jgi:hypothetical protein